MERKGTLLSVRSDVRVLDATIRDGGLVSPSKSSDDRDAR